MKTQIILPTLAFALVMGVVTLAVTPSFSAVSPISITADDEVTIKNALGQIGLTTPVHTIMPTGIGELLEVTLTTGESLLITPDARYVINATAEPNPSPIHPISTAIISHHPTGIPINHPHQTALLANMTALPLVTADTVFFHTSIKGLLWAVADNGTPFLVSDDARYIIGGDITVIKNGRLMGLDVAFETIKNHHALTSLDADTLTIYPAKNERAVAYVATDIHCPYCRVFHKNISTLNAQGITVKVIGYPVYDESPEPMRQIWCEPDNTKRAKLLDLAMKGIHPKNQCKNNVNPLLKNIIKIRPLSIIATPAVYRETGELYEGSIQNDELLVQFLTSER